jgi:hypothetical protein
MPDYATSKLQYLSWLGDAILVCAGEKEELLCVDAATGKVSWRVPRVWEFQRGFIGPSVWSHFIARFGSENLRGELGTPDEEKARAEEEKELKTLRAEFEKQFQCAIIAGPLVMPAAKKANRKLGDPDDARIFLAVAKGPNAWNYGYLSECIAYELSGSGRVLTMANLPRIVRGYQYSTASGGLVWGCEKGAIVRLESAHSQWGGMGPGGPDLLCTIAWYRQFAAPELDGWLTADKVRDVVAFDSARAYRAVAGGYVAKKEEMIYRFPLSVVDLAGGAEATAILVVPYKGTLSLPTQNFSTLALQTHAHGPYLLGVTQLNVEGEQLEVTLGMEKTSVGVTFDLGKLKAPGQK